MGRIFKRDEIKLRRSWKRRILIGFNCFLATLLILGVAGAGYVKWRFGQISKINLNGVLGGNAGSSDPMTVLLVGSDTREGLNQPGDTKSFGSAGKVGGQRSDTIMLLHVDPKTQHAAILSLPRDLWVPIAGSNGKNRINTAFENASGEQTGAENLIKTIQTDFNIPIDHYAEVDFDSFRSVVNSVGGVDVPFAAPARDWGLDESTGRNGNLSGLDVKDTGCVNLSGNMALSYVRSRHFQLFENGKWISDPLSDLGRIQRQQDFIRRVMSKAISKGKSNPLTLNALVSNGVSNLTLDKTFSLSDITSVANRFHSLDANKVEMMTLPNAATNVGGASVLVPKEPDVQETVNRFLHGDSATADDANIPPSSISIRVLNGSGQPGQASTTSGGLGNVGFVVLGTGDAAARNSATTIRYATGEKAKADIIAKYLSGKVTEVQDSSVKGLDAIVTTGSSFEGVNSTGTTTSTSSTVPPAKSATTTTASPFVPNAAETC